ncbi:hypothetical protein [Algoriphagus chordae]|uniref:hypothetical protein n=1 Tax=Algoriphagus chordae TaxID=237019 RepID=UPI000DAEB1C7|nr:hypothetical protein [Algoriphagus chordae]
MEIAASFVLILSIYFLGSLALVQDIIRPQKEMVLERETSKQQSVTNYPQILSLSFGISLFTTLIAYYLFL